MRSVSRNDDDVSCEAPSDLGADSHLDLSREDVQDLLAVVQVQRATLAGAELASCKHDAAQSVVTPGNCVEADCRRLVPGEVGNGESV